MLLLSLLLLRDSMNNYLRSMLCLPTAAVCVEVLPATFDTTTTETASKQPSKQYNLRQTAVVLLLIIMLLRPYLYSLLLLQSYKVDYLHA